MKIVHFKRTAAIVSTVLLAVGSTGCSLLPNEGDKVHNIVVKEEQQLNYDLVEVVRTDVKRTKNIYFKYSQMDEESYGFVLDGQRIIEVCVNVGDNVEVGDVLARIDTSGAKAQLEELYYNRESSQLNLKHTKERMQYEINRAADAEQVAAIRERYKGSLQNFDDELKILGMKIEQYEKIAENGEIYATMAGRVTKVKSGLVGKRSVADEEIITVIDTTKCSFRTERNELTEGFTEGMRVTLTRNNGETYSGTITPIEGGDNDKFIYLKLDEVAEDLVVGIDATYQLVLESSENALALPILTVHTMGDKHYIYYESEDGLKSIKYITVGMKGDTMYEIVDGLTEGEVVIK